MFNHLRLMPPIHEVGASGFISSGIDLLPWRMTNEPWELGAAGVKTRTYAEGPGIIGGIQTSEQSGVRLWSFPLMLASNGTYSGLQGLERAIRIAAQPGGWLEYRTALPGAIGASSPVMRVDLLGGELVPQWNERVHQVARGRAQLLLETAPIAYPASSPFLLRTVASVQLPGTLTVDGASVLGEHGGYLRLTIRPRVATTWPVGSWVPDALGFVCWREQGNVGAEQGDHLLLGGNDGGFASGIGGTQMANPMAIPGQNFLASVYCQRAYLPSWGQWRQVRVNPRSQANGFRTTDYGFSSGRNRLFGYFRLGPSQGMPWQLIADTAPYGAENIAPLASAQPVATLAPAVASGDPGAWGAQASPAFTVLDFGEITLPALGASGFKGSLQTWIRFWAYTPSSVATSELDFGGLLLLPADKSSLIVRGVHAPTTTMGSQYAGYWDGRPQAQLAWAVAPLASNLASIVPVADRVGELRGGFPMMPAVAQSGENIRFQVWGADRKAASGAGEILVHANLKWAEVRVEYQPDFVFLASAVL